MFINLTRHLDARGIKYSLVEGHGNAVFFGIRTEVGQYQCIADVDENDSIFVFYAIMGIATPAEKRLKMAELLTRINYGIPIGNFEMDFNDGEIRYKTSLDYEGFQLTDTNIHNVISANISTVDRFLNAIMKLIIDDVLPKDIFEGIAAELTN